MIRFDLACTYLYFIVFFYDIEFDNTYITDVIKLGFFYGSPADETHNFYRLNAFDARCRRARVYTDFHIAARPRRLHEARPTV